MLLGKGMNPILPLLSLVIYILWAKVSFHCHTVMFDGQKNDWINTINSIRGLATQVVA